MKILELTAGAARMYCGSCLRDNALVKGLRARAQCFLADAAKGMDAIAVTHMGVLRAAYVLATDWDMSAAMPAELNLTAALVLSLDKNGAPEIARLNAPLRMRG